MRLQIFQVDAFTNKPFSGNPAAVCLLSEPISTELMQNIAMEMNLSETAFLHKEKNGFRLRWFTPQIEVELCGHATLASAHILNEMGSLQKNETAIFYTHSGILTATYKKERIELNFPVLLVQKTPIPPGLTKALNTDHLFVGKHNEDYLIEVESEERVRSIKPNFFLLASLPAQIIIITSISQSTNYDFVSRVFAPAVGVNEDPVTGSAYCYLAPYWSKKLKKTRFNAFQASSRGGAVKSRLVENRVYLSGQAVTVLKGELLINNV